MILFNVTRNRQKSLIHWAKHHEIDFPSEPENLEKVTHLSLRFKGVEQLPREIKFLVNLEEIDASYNYISEIPWEFGALKKLKRINFSHNRLQDIPGVICKHTPLLSLNLEGNHIRKVPAIIANLINLETLNLAFNEIIEIPNEFKYLVSLKELDLAGNQLSELPSSFSKLPSLKEIKIWKNLFEQLPKELEKISTLTAIENEVDIDRLSKLFIESVKFDDVAAARKYLTLGADVNYRWEGYENQQFTTALFEAKSVEMVKFLLENGADVNIARIVKKSESFIFWESEKQETETFLTKKHSAEITRYLKSINLLED
ncbi:MAG: leucine-rich repeat domain-containing protein [Bacteroidales bacterium]|nr:leucine-rich repeat domain-containing protein [Bacteroidales bacterium]